MLVKKFRQEKDSLGWVHVPKNAFYGAQTCRALTHFKISKNTADASLIRALLSIKGAAALTNQTCGTLSAEHSQLIQKAVDELLMMPIAKWPEIFPIDSFQAGAGTSQNMNVNEVVANWANHLAGKPLGSYSPIHPNNHVNQSQSTNDVYPSAMRLALLEVSTELVKEIRLLSLIFEKKAEIWAEIPKAARTHLQDAVPITLGQEFGAYGAMLLRCTHWIEKAREEISELGIGGSAAGTGLNVPSGFTSIIMTELSRSYKINLRSALNLCESMQSQAPLSFYSSMLRITALELTRVCNDLRLLASGPANGLAEITLPAVQPGSSIMPGKVNPSILEAMNQILFAVLGHDQTVSFAMQAGQLELNVMMPVMAYALLDATQILTKGIGMMRTFCIEGIEPQTERLRRYSENTPQLATALSPLLGYEQTAMLVQQAQAQGLTLLDLLRKEVAKNNYSVEVLAAAEAALLPPMGKSKASKSRSSSTPSTEPSEPSPPSPVSSSGVAPTEQPGKPETSPIRI